MERASLLIPGFEKFAQVAFPLICIAAFGEAAYKAVEEVRELRQESIDAASKIRDSFDAINSPIQKNADELHKSNAELDLNIAKLEHKPGNYLALEMANAAIATVAAASITRPARAATTDPHSFRTGRGARNSPPPRLSYRFNGMPISMSSPSSG